MHLANKPKRGLNRVVDRWFVRPDDGSQLTNMNFGETKIKKAEVKIGGKYYANVSAKRTEIQIESEKVSGGWNAINLATGKKILIKNAQRLSV